MSQITRCPFCATTFKVVADQLRISDGWVRCGHCKQVFDASEHLLSAESRALLPELPLSGLDATVPVPASAEPPPSPRASDEGNALTPLSVLLKREAPGEPAASPPGEIQGYELPSASPDDSGWPREFDDEVASETVEELRVETQAEAESGVGAADPCDEEPQASPPETAVEPPETVAQDPETVLVEGVALMPGSISEAALPEAAAPASDEPGFMKDARRGAFWRQPAVRVALAMAGLVLLLALGLQIAVQERDVIAARNPAARAVMEGLCAPLQCRLQAPQHIAAVVIDSSSFLKDRDDASVYQLQLSLKNNSAHTVAMPALELTLTDARDQAVVRRVLLRADLGAPVELAPGATWSGTLTMRLTQGADQVAGYRLLAFYP